MLDVAWFSIAITNTCWIADEVAAGAPSVGASSSVRGGSGSGLSSAQPANARLPVMMQASRFIEVPPYRHLSHRAGSVRGAQVSSARRRTPVWYCVTCATESAHAALDWQ